MELMDSSASSNASSQDFAATDSPKGSKFGSSSEQVGCLSFSPFYLCSNRRSNLLSQKKIRMGFCATLLAQWILLSKPKSLTPVFQQDAPRCSAKASWLTLVPPQQLQKTCYTLPAS